MHLRKIIAILFLFFLLVTSTPSNAQCPMCRTAVESAKEIDGSTKGDGLNKGILYLLSLPYLTVALVGGIWYTKRKNAKKGNVRNNQEH